MLTASDPRPGLNRTPCESGCAQKLIKEKAPTHTPVWYRLILNQAMDIRPAYTPLPPPPPPLPYPPEINKDKKVEKTGCETVERGTTE